MKKIIITILFFVVTTGSLAYGNDRLTLMGLIGTGYQSEIQDIPGYGSIENIYYEPRMEFQAGEIMYFHLMYQMHRKSKVRITLFFETPGDICNTITGELCVTVCRVFDGIHSPGNVSSISEVTLWNPGMYQVTAKFRFGDGTVRKIKTKIIILPEEVSELDAFSF